MTTNTMPEGVTLKDVPTSVLDRVTRSQMGNAERALSLVVDGKWSIVVPRPGSAPMDAPDVCGPCATGDHAACLGGCACVTGRIVVDG
jgi:hypothetical protein